MDTFAEASAIVIGESLIDIVPGRDGPAEHPGGSPMNVAVGLARLGRRTQLATWFGRDARGRTIAAHLAASNVGVLAGSDQAERTPTAEVIFDSHGSARYVFDLTWSPPPLPAGAAPLVAHAGSVGAALQPGAGDVLAALAELRSRGASVSFDPNCRPQIIGPADGVRPLLERFVAVADVVKASDEDLAWLYPGADPLVSARGWLAAGPSLLVLTMGARGVIGLTKNHRVDEPAPDVRVVDTVGAGDAFMAGLLHGLWAAGLLGGPIGQMDETAMRQVLALASKVSAVTLTRAGADPPWRSELLG
jgi:fructokinase